MDNRTAIAMQATPLHNNRRGLRADTKILPPIVIYPPFTTLTQSLSLRQSSNSWRSPLQGRGLMSVASSSVSSIVPSDGWGLRDLLRMRIYCKHGTGGETMRFNHRELSLYASSRLGKADKEGCLWVKEGEGILRKKESECNGVEELSVFTWA